MHSFKLIGQVHSFTYVNMWIPFAHRTPREWSLMAWTYILILQFTSCVSQGKSPSLSVSHCPLLCPTVLFCILEIMMILRRSNRRIRGVKPGKSYTWYYVSSRSKKGEGSHHGQGHLVLTEHIQDASTVHQRSRHHIVQP